MPIEHTTMPVTRYRSPTGQPTCASDFYNGEICLFLQTYKLGTCETCFFIPDERHKKVLERGVSSEGHVGQGYLMPFDGCPVWAEREKDADH